MKINRFNRHIRRISCCVMLVFVACALTVLARATNAASDRDQKILILMGPHYGLPMLEAIVPAMVSTLTENGFSLDDLLVEFLDVHRYRAPEHRATVLALLEHKIEEHDVGLIIAINQGAVDYVARDGRDLLPGVPMLIPILEDLPAWAGEPRQLITIESRQDATGTLRHALALFPRTERVLIIMGEDDHEAPFVKPILKALDDLPERLQVETTAHLAYEQMLERIATLPDDTIAFYGSIFDDITGRSFVPAEVAAQVARVANRPVFAFRDMHILQGLMGGSVVKTSLLGEQAAHIALDYLAGDLVLDHPVTSFEAPMCRFSTGDRSSTGTDGSAHYQPTPSFSIGHRLFGASIGTP